MSTGPLKGIRVLEIAGIGPGPFCAMMLADMGADVVRVDRPSRGAKEAARKDILNRSRRSIAIDLKSDAGRNLLLDLAKKADVLLEGFRPGVMERLGLGPEEMARANPKLIYARMTGWGQDGPWAKMAGHDINYIALAGVLDHLGRKGEKPTPPINLIGDFGGGGMMMAFGIVCALLESQRSGQGQVVDGAMVDGAALLMTMMHAFKAMGMWNEARGRNMLDTGAHFYDVYETADEKYLAIGPIEPQFYAEFLAETGLDEDPVFAAQMNAENWDALKDKVSATVLQKTQAEWMEIFEGSDACVAPVLSMSDAPQHPHMKARGTFVEADGFVQPAPAPRFSRTAPGEIKPAPAPGEHSHEILSDWGISAEEITALIEKAVIRQT